LEVTVVTEDSENDQLNFTKTLFSFLDKGERRSSMKNIFSIGGFYTESFEESKTKVLLFV